ncbi:MAG TPA: pseudouridine synthase [Bacillota bacterium]|nr:pseudouridine synthase [Bacillota bacterium]
MTNNLERLQKVIARSGVTSRRKAEQFIINGRVKVNGKKITKLGTKVSPTDNVEVDDILLEKEAPVYYMLYKPQGVISSVKDDKNRAVVLDYFPDVTKRIYPIGRLDYNTSGLLLLTNDGEFANSLLHPSHEVDKVYIAKIKGIPTKQQLGKFQKGITSQHDVLKANDAIILSSDRKKNTSIIQVTLHEGKNRQVRRMFDELGFEVKKLKREKFGFLTLKGLNPGDQRKLTPHEVKQLHNLATRNVKQ